MGERIVVTGGAGFIGSHVAEAYLGAGHQVLILDDLSSGRRENLPVGAAFTQLDIRDRQAVRTELQRFRPTVVNHHAAQKSVTDSVRDPVKDAQINVLGLIHVLEAAVAAGTGRVVFASTGGALYGSGAPVPADESVRVAPDAPYGTSKYCGEQYLSLYGRLHGLPSVVLRYSNVYGPRQDPHGEAGVVAIFSLAILSGRPCRIFGDGEQTRDYVHVADVARANLLALSAPAGTYNIGTGVETSVNALVQQLQRGTELPVRVEHAEPRPGEARRSAVDAGLAARTFGWRPEVQLADGLAQTFAWFRERAG